MRPHSPGFQHPSDRFSGTLVFLHWLMVVLMVAVYFGMEGRGLIPKEIRGPIVRVIHYSFGITIFFLVWIRLAIRLRSPVPPIVPEPPGYQQFLARVMHLALYGFMIGMPLLAYFSYSLKGKTVWFYGMEFPLLTTVDKELAKQLKLMTWHKEIAWWGYWLLGFHAVAALAHHYLFKDNTLARILPRRAGKVG